MTQVEAKVVAAWREAAKDLGIQFTAPFSAERDGRHFDALGFVHHFGRRIGTIISVIDKPSSLPRHPAADDYYSSQLSDSYTRYDRQFFGEDSERPFWYSGKPWS